MKILFIDTSENLGGGQTVGINVVNALIKKHQVICLVPANTAYSGKLKDIAIVNHIPALMLSKSNKNLFDIFILFKYFFSNFKLLKNSIRNAEHVYISNVKILPVLYFFLRFYNLNYTLHIHLVHSKIIFYIINVLSIRGRSKIIFCSSTLYNKCSKYFHKKRLFIVENSLSENLSKINYLNRFNSKITIGYLGGSDRLKGIKIAFELANIFKNIPFIFFGVNKDDELRKIYSTLNNVIFLEKFDNINNAINDNSINIVIYPSIVDESFGLIPLESASLSCIPIVSNRDALLELSNALNCAFCTTLNDYTNVINKLIFSPKNILNLESRIIHRNALKVYNFENFSNAINKLF